MDGMFDIMQVLRMLLTQAVRYRTVADRIFGLRLISARRHFQREVSYEFMNRQMVWHAFTVRTSFRCSPSLDSSCSRNSCYSYYH